MVTKSTFAGDKNPKPLGKPKSKQRPEEVARAEAQVIGEDDDDAERHLGPDDDDETSIVDLAGEIFLQVWML